MRPPLFEACAASPRLQALLGDTAELRVYQFADAPQHCATPYLVWQLVYGEPMNAMNQLPTMDYLGVQVDIYGPEQDPSVARSVAEAARDALEPYGHIVSWDGEERDPDTREYRVTFTMDWWLRRPVTDTTSAPP